MNPALSSTTIAGGTSRATRRWLTALMLGAMYIFLASSFISIAVNSLALGLMAVCWVALMIVESRWNVVRTPLDLFFLAYILAELLSTMFSENRSQSLLFSKRLLLIGIVYFLATMITDDRLAKRSVAVLLGTAALVAMLGVGKLLVGNASENGRLGIFQFYMTTSELMMVAALLVLPFIVHPRTPRSVRLAAVVGFLPIVISLYATVTRGAYLAAGAGMLLIAFLRDKRILVPVIVLLVLLVFVAPPFVENRIMSIVDIHHPENESRLMLWGTALKIFADHPLVGVGDIDLGELLKQYAGPGYPGLWGHVHNVVMQILVTLGIIGLTAFVAMFVKICLTEWRAYRMVRDEWFAGSVALGALAAFTGFVVSGITEWSFGDQEVVILFWISVGFSLAVTRLRGSGRVMDNGGTVNRSGLRSSTSPGSD